MPHKLIKTSGHAVVYTRLTSGGVLGLKGTFPPSMLARMGSSSKVTFAKAGVYRFTTKPGTDYMAGIRTVGADTVLKLDGESQMSSSTESDEGPSAPRLLRGAEC